MQRLLTRYWRVPTKDVQRLPWSRSFAYPRSMILWTSCRKQCHIHMVNYREKSKTLHYTDIWREKGLPFHQALVKLCSLVLGLCELSYFHGDTGYQSLFFFLNKENLHVLCLNVRFRWALKSKWRQRKTLPMSLSSERTSLSFSPQQFSGLFST